MNYRFPARALAFLTPFFASCSPTDNQSKAADAIVYEGRTMRVLIPECPLAQGSLKIEPKVPATHFSEWSSENDAETYSLIKKISRVWDKQGIDFFDYGKESDAVHSKFSWEVVPFPKTGSIFWRIWNQFWVLFHTTFGGSCLSKIEQQRTAEKIREQIKFSEPIEEEAEVKSAVEKCAFCDPKVIEKQWVFKGKTVQVLYTHAPISIGKDKLHFLVIPMRHAKKFNDLTLEEYQEASDLSRKLVCLYKNEGFHTAYLFNKSGKNAGQTVPHWHQHLVFTATKTQEFFGKLTVLKNMLFGSSVLPEAELKARVEALRTKLSHLGEQPAC